MSKHTPGPWTVHTTLRPDEDDDPMGEYLVEPAATNLTQRYLDAEYDTPELDDVHTENQANASLIAAAPDLLIACRAMLECQANLCESCIRLARAAIAKADGEI